VHYSTRVQTIAVLNQKGGVGKSTLSANLAAIGHLRGRRTLVLDLDAQGSSFDWYNARGEGSSLSGLACARADRALTLAKFRELARGYELVVCDGPPRLGDVTRAAAVAADVIVIPVRPGGYDYWALAETIERLDAADAIRSELGHKAARRLFVVNGAVASKVTQAIFEALSEVGPVARTIVANRVVYGQAALEGEAVITREPGSRAAQEMNALFDEVMS
jgi:chromosome partitioning protein